MNSRVSAPMLGLFAATAPAPAFANDGASLVDAGFAPLSWLVFLPLLGSLAAWLTSRFAHASSHALRRLMLLFSGAALALAGWLYASFDLAHASAVPGHDYQLVERKALLPSFGVEYFLGVDGISITLILLTSLLAFIATIASPSTQRRPALYWAGQGLLVTGMLGAFAALDLALLYVFWQLALVGACLLVGCFGGEGKKAATMKLAVSGIVGSAALLFAIVVLYLHLDPAPLADGGVSARSFALPDLARVDYLGTGATLFGTTLVKAVFVALFLAFAGLLAIFPFHPGIIDALVEAPTSVSLLLAGAWLKLGGYGLLRLNLGLLPEASAWAATTMALLGIASLFFGSLRALFQTDIKRFVAHVSVAQLGYCLFGMASLTPSGIQASIMQMVSHGLVVALLFVLAETLESRAQTREMSRFGGLASELPGLSLIATVGFMASVGAPGLSGFVGESMALMGAFPVHERLTIVAVLGIGLAAACHIRAFRMLFLGSFRQEWRSSDILEPFGGKFPGLRPRELLTIAPLASLVVLLGFWPRPLLALTDTNAVDLANALRPLGPMQISLADMSRQLLALLQ